VTASLGILARHQQVVQRRRESRAISEGPPRVLCRVRRARVWTADQLTGRGHCRRVEVITTTRGRAPSLGSAASTSSLSVHLRHPHIEEHQIVGAGAQAFQDVHAGLRRRDRESGAAFSISVRS
jgi:hypothetical protein